MILRIKETIRYLKEVTYSKDKILIFRLEKITRENLLNIYFIFIKL